MAKLTKEERIKIIEFYFKNQNSIVRTQREYARHFNVRSPPSKIQIIRLVKHFRAYGSVCDLPSTGRPRSVRTEDNRERVQRSIQEEAGTSIRRRSQELGISRSSLERLQNDLKMYPYKIQMVQQLNPIDFRPRIAYAHRILEKAREPNFLDNLIMGDEAHFQLNGVVNRQNTRFWGTTNPRIIHERQLHPLKVTVWCGVTSTRVIGPYFFEGEDGETVTVNGERYRAMIENLIRPEVEDKPETWWQQDGATAHTARQTMQLLREIFGERIISRYSDFNWPSRSPDLTAPDFFLWGYLKDRVFRSKPRTLPHLRNNIQEEIQAIGPDTLRKVMEQAMERARLCLANNGGHLRDIIFHT